MIGSVGSNSMGNLGSEE